MSNQPELATLLNNPSFCSMAWNHQFMDPTGRVKPCCRFEEMHRPPENNLNKSDLKSIFYGPWMDEVRQKMLNGDLIKGCARCYQEEQSRKKSLRQRYNSSPQFPIEDLVNIKQPKITWLELAISNACNLACRMCDSRYSRKWFDEELELFGATQSKKKIEKFDISNIFPFLDDIVHLKFTGGEPLITTEHWNLISKIVNENRANNIFLNYSTNCTIYPKKEWIDLWDKFKFVEFALSFDSCDKNESEYIRWPEDYETIENTTLAFIELAKKRPNFKAILRTTVSILNIWHLPETILWWIKNTDSRLPINPTHLTHPNFLSVTALPMEIKKQISAKFNLFKRTDTLTQLTSTLTYVENYMFSIDNSYLIPKFYDYVLKTDTSRGQNFNNIYDGYFFDIFKSIPKNNSYFMDIIKT